MPPRRCSSLGDSTLEDGDRHLAIDGRFAASTLEIAAARRSLVFVPWRLRPNVASVPVPSSRHYAVTPAN